MKYFLTLVAGLGLYCASVSCHAPTAKGAEFSTTDASVEASVRPLSFNVTGMT
jgi:multidrug resistance efflux pump